MRKAGHGRDRNGRGGSGDAAARSFVRPTCALIAALVCALPAPLFAQAPAPSSAQSPTPAPAPAPEPESRVPPISSLPQPDGETRRQFYIGGAVGYAGLRDGDIGANTRLEMQGTLSGLASVGVKLRGMLRLEAELGYRSHGLDTATLSGRQVADTGNISVLTGMANSLLELGSGKIRPYAGVGIGLLRYSFDDVSVAGQAVTGSDTHLAWQIIAGFAYQVTPRFALSVDYRYIDSENPQITYLGGRREYQDLTSQSFNVGLRLGF